MNRADIPAQPLKAKQLRLLDVFRSLGPITIKRAALEIHGDMDPLHIRMVHRGLCRPRGDATRLGAERTRLRPRGRS